MIVVETDDFTGGQIGSDSTHEDLLALDFATIYIYTLAGHIHVAGAEPGDVLAVELLGFELRDWGWAAIIPVLGLLPSGELKDPYLKFFDREFKDPYLKFFDLTQGDTTSPPSACGSPSVRSAARRVPPSGHAR